MLLTAVKGHVFTFLCFSKLTFRKDTETQDNEKGETETE